MASLRTQELGVGVLLIGAFVVLAWMAVSVGALGSLGPTVEVTARFANAAGIKEGAAVAVAGVEVGKVAGLRLEHDVAVVTMRLDAEAGLTEGSGVRIRARSVLGEKYLSLEPGPADAARLTDGAQLAVVGEQLEIDQMVGAVGPLLEALDGDALAASLSALSAALSDDPERLTRMIRDAEVMLDEGARAAESLPELVARAEATLDRADRALDALGGRADQAGGTLRRADALLTSLQGSADAVPALLDDTRGAVGDARLAVAEAREVLAGVDSQLDTVLSNFGEIDKWEMRRLLREEGILIRVRPHEVVVPASAE